MNKLILTLLAATGLSSSTLAQPPAEPPPPPAQPAAAPQATMPAVAPTESCRRRINATPAMWQVKDEDTTIYLFGTFHLLDACRDWFKGPVRAAFERSDELVLEVVLPENTAELQPLIMRLAVDPQGRTVTSRLTASEVAALRRQLGPATDAIDQAKLEPWFVNLTLTNLAAQRLHLDPASGPETVLRAAATARHMPVRGVETAEFQFNIFDTMPEEMQLSALKETINNPDETGRTLRPMLNAWSSGNSDQLARIMNAATEDSPQLYRRLLIDRNAAWARWIQQRLQQPGTVFMAVGAGHLGGVGSVQEQLKWLGIGSSRVPTR